MAYQETLDRLTRIPRDLLADDRIVLTMPTIRDDMRGTDSFSYINCIVAAEAELRVKVRIADDESFADVGDIVTNITAQRPH